MNRTEERLDDKGAHEGIDRAKRSRRPSRKALQNAVEIKRRDISSLHKRLLRVIQAAEGLDDSCSVDSILRELTTASEELQAVLQELIWLYEQDEFNELGEEALLTNEIGTIKRAYILVDRLKNRESDKLLETSSRRSRHSSRNIKPARSLSSTSTVNSVRMKALAEAAAASESAVYERMIAEKEHERRKLEAAIEQERAQHEKDLAFLAANKKVAVAGAKLKAIEQAIIDDEIGEECELPGVPGAKSEERTLGWVHTIPCPEEVPVERMPITQPQNVPKQTAAFTQSLEMPAPNLARPANQQNDDSTQRVLSQRPVIASTPIRDISGSQLIETLTSVNQQIVTSLARQNFPKCQPDNFNGDATLFHPWKAAFKAMIKDADVSPVQEINYLRSFTTGEPQRLVDNFRRRQQNDPVTLLESLWKELESRFGSIAVITNALLERMQKTAAFSESDNTKLQQFADLCADVESQMSCLPGLACLNYPNAIQPITEKLPSSLRGKWEKEIVKCADRNAGAYPSFRNFAKVVEDQAKLKNNPNILAGSKSTNNPSNPFTPSQRRVTRKALKTDARPAPRRLETTPRENEYEKKRCLFHDREGHDLMECNAFAAKPLDEKTEWIRRARLCFRCLSEGHQASKCRAKISCSICGDERHIALLHKVKEGEDSALEDVNNRCTGICDSSGGVSCSKILLVDVFSQNKPEQIRRIYAIVDEQSNSSLISSELADELGAEGPPEKYHLSTCSGEREEKYGRRVTGTIIRSLNGVKSVLPTLVECDNIPQDRREIPTPEMARRFPHLQEIAKEIPPLDGTANIHLLIGRDSPELLKVREFRNGPRGAPWAHRLILGWTITGQMCLDFVDGPVHVLTRHTSLHTANAEGYKLIPCPNQFKIRESLVEPSLNDVFLTTKEDNEVSLSCEDRKFLEIMESGVHKNGTGNLEMPLPFRQGKLKLPNNKAQAVNRLNGLLRTLKRKPQMQQDYLSFMEKILEKGHASPVPPEEGRSKDHVWYLPHFGVYHPKKPTQIRVVFDSSAEYQGESLNKALLSGPDLMNSLVGVLIRFRKENIAVMCDIEQMFHSFHVDPKHRDFLRFLWFKDNDPQKEIIDYRMNVHLFGNGPSPAVATFGLRKTAADGEEEFREDAKKFVCRNFYVDDGLASTSTPKEAIDLVTRAQAMLAKSKLRLHKVVSNSVEVMEAFPLEDRGKDVRDLDLRRDSLPAQRSLGVYWDLENDAFTFKVHLPDKPFTRRGVLSVVNSVYDPLGLAVPVLLEGRLLLQKLVSMGKRKNNDAPLGWDDPLPDNLLQQWQRWRSSLTDLEKVSVPRCYHPEGFGRVVQAEIHAFADASQDAIGAAVYLRLVNGNGEVATALLLGQSKVAPVQTTTIPRLELCAAVLATQVVARVLKEIDMHIDDVIFYSDSKAVLGYIQNESRRFYVYVANRVQVIRGVSQPSQWRYIETDENPADLATRCLTASNLSKSTWLTGPRLLKDPSAPQPQQVNVPLDDGDPEVRMDVLTSATRLQKDKGLGTERFSRFSSLASLQRAIALLIVRGRELKLRKSKTKSKTKHKMVLRNKPPRDQSGPRNPTVEELGKAITVIIRETQKEAFGRELEKRDLTSAFQKDEERGKDIARKKALKGSSLYRLDPFIDKDGILRVGGRLRRAEMEYGEKHPILLPKNHHVSRLIVRHYHEQVHHQGRQLTGGSVRNAGYWLIGGHSTISRELSSCVPCKKMRGPHLVQQMADLPAERSDVCPPFTNVGFDVFGPWTIHTRKTRGGIAQSKRWGLVFTCLNSRGIHIEVLEAMDASAFICALRRFFALRGPATVLRCDRGTNFIGGKSEQDEALHEMDQKKIERFLVKQACHWKFNPPHASHFGGVWERQIGTIRRVLDAMLAELDKKQLSHELLVTLMAEVTAIVNARPIAAIPTDVEDPLPLSPAMLLTMKTRPLGSPPGSFVSTDLYARRRWRRIQYLAEQFWVRWRREYLQALQARNKWNEPQRNLAKGDIVLLREEGEHRNDWPMGRVTEAIKSDDGLVRKANVAILKEGKMKTFLRPIKELILLVPIQTQAD